MSIVSVDDRGRLTIPKELGIRQQRVIVIPAGSFFITIPLPEDPLLAGKDWLETGKPIDELRERAEKLAHQDAVKRRRRNKKGDD